MKFFVMTDEPLVLERIKTNKAVSIRFVDEKDHFGESAPFPCINEGKVKVFTCPFCKSRLAGDHVNYCMECGGKNESFDI